MHRSKCYCGNSIYAKYGHIYNSNCSVMCIGNTSQTCGNYVLNSIYRTSLGNFDNN